MIFSHVILYVKDVKASTKFYEKAFRLQTKFLHESGEYAEMDTGATAIAFASTALSKMSLPSGITEHSLLRKPQATEIVLETEDVDEAYAHAVSSGASPLTPPTDMPWGQRMSRVRDLDGIIVEICNPMHD